MTSALEGIRILDLTTVLMGPSATQMLGDMGADVIKVEAPDGDGTRKSGYARTPGMSAWFLNLNRGKRGLAIDLKAPDGRAALLRLAETVDVLLYNIRPAAMDRLRAVLRGGFRRRSQGGLCRRARLRARRPLFQPAGL